eukprot:TRINITY_DN3008_c0_g2_i6.p3 TRINITY_DN3008_c0_g2~~TRINITY_DN3008_c0_g2_i6.p3  ORF type:complete len:113 (-),score=21.74 TRINITY_DN3008_c0_g2_i6:961-1299(-)
MPMEFVSCALSPTTLNWSNFLSINRSDWMAGWMRDWSRNNPVRLNIKQGACFVSDFFNMDDALNLLVTHSLIVVDLPAASFTISRPSVDFVLSNSLGCHLAVGGRFLPHRMD